jgi:hypothetical protein
MEILEKLRTLSQTVPKPTKLPTENDLRNVEEKLDFKFPPSYVKYQLNYSDVALGTFEPYQLFEDGSYLDLLNGIIEAQELGLPKNLIPFLEDNADFYCFDTNSTAPEFEVRFWSHNGETNEKWKNFLDWVENCWIEENQ